MKSQNTTIVITPFDPLSPPEVGLDIDVSQLRRNLAMPIENRLKEHQMALDLVLDLIEAGKRGHEQPQ